MSDFSADGPRMAWLETELARQFAPVSAPDALWRQIHEQRRPLRVQPRRWTIWLMAAAGLLILCAGLVRRSETNRDRAAEMESLAGRELRGLADGSGEFDIRSGDPKEIQAWVMAKAGIDIPLPERPAVALATKKDAVRLLGARLVRLEGSAVAVILYRVGDDFAAMLVADKTGGTAGSMDKGHSPVRTGTAGNPRWYSWSLGRQDYTIAFGVAKDPRRACLLCHADAPALMVLR